MAAEDAPNVREEQLNRVPIRFDTDRQESQLRQHGTVLWKYMTQNTFRLS
jgi:hypothetical protein